MLCLEPIHHILNGFDFQGVFMSQTIASINSSRKVRKPVYGICKTDINWLSEVLETR